MNQKINKTYIMQMQNFLMLENVIQIKSGIKNCVDMS